MTRPFDRSRSFTRRAFLIGGVQALAFTALAGRLYYLQFVRSDEYTTLSENNRIKLTPIVPERGHLLDRFGNTLAENTKNYRLFFDPSSHKREPGEAVIRKAAALVGIGEKRLAQILSGIRFSAAADPYLLKDHLSWEELSRVELHLLDMPGITIETGQVRAYPFSDHTAHLLGYVGAVAKEEMKEGEEESLLRMPDFKIGKSGVERLLDDRLRGLAGVRKVEVNVHGVAVREQVSSAAVPGENIRLTIDARLQEYAVQLFGGETGAAVIMDVHNGDVRALVSLPGFDPNAFSQGIAAEYWKQLNEDIKNPLLNKAIAGQYPPGSTFKMIVGLAGLEAGVVNEHSTVFCPGHFFLGDHQFNCWKEDGHGSVNLREAMAGSCDTYFYTLAQRIGILAIARMSRRFALGEVTGIGLFGEKAGIVPDPEWKMKRFKQRWQAGDTINVGIGQGYVLTTPLQLAVMTARLVNGGYAVVPRLLHEDGSLDDFNPVGVEEAHLKVMDDAMRAVVNSPGGTAYGRRIPEPRFAMGGKTGTSQVRAITKRGVDQSTLPWEHRHHALFVGYAPVDKPRYACAVLVEHGGGGAAAAAPIARDLLQKIQQLDETDYKQSGA